jgi:hypothetical protein
MKYSIRIDLNPFFFYHMDHDYHLSSFLLYAAAAGSTLTQVYSTRGWRGDLRHALKIVFELQNVFKKYFDLKKKVVWDLLANRVFKEDAVNFPKHTD